MRNIFFFLCLLPAYLSAQIVNVEAKRKTVYADTTGWFGGGDVGFNLNENGKTVLTGIANASVEYWQGKNLWLSLTNYKVVRANREDFVNQGFQHFRYNREWTPKIIREAFIQIQYDQRLGIRLRALAGMGPRFQLLKNEHGHLFFGTLYMYQYEELATAGIIHRDHRLSTYLSFRIKIKENARLYGTTYYQPLLTNLRITRIASQTALELDFTEKLSFRAAFNIALDNRLSAEVSDVPIAVYSLENGLKWRF